VSSEEIGDLLIALWRRWRAASPVGRGAITQEQYWVLKTLDSHGPLKVKDLASMLGCTPGSASVAVKRLEQGGMVKRRRSEDDERVVTVTLARAGGEKLRAWRGAQTKALAALFEPLDSEERDMLRELLVRALAAAGDARTPSNIGGRGRGL
jgi:DNA-binding MarR family transcriptional regulator